MFLIRSSCNRGVIEIRISPHYQQPGFWVSISVSTKSLTLHYIGKAMHSPHHNRDGEHDDAVDRKRSSISQTQQKGQLITIILLIMDDY